MANSQRILPNILVTGTPGVGKSTLCEQLAERTGLEWLEVGQIAKDCECYEEYDEVYQCPVLDEDKLIDEMEDIMGQGGKIVDYHGCDFFPERWFDIVFVLRTNNTALYDRLTHRGYTGKKLEDNVQCEIFQTILEEAQEAYKSDIVYELPSNTPDDMEENLDKIAAWIEEWKMRTLSHQGPLPCTMESSQLKNYMEQDTSDQDITALNVQTLLKAFLVDEAFFW